MGSGNPGGGGGTNPPPAGGGATVGMEAVYFHHNDHLGTPQALTDINGTKVWEVSQTPFGIATVNEDVDGDGILVTNNFRFPSQYYDAETGFYYNYHRSYNPALDRYFQHDPIGINGGLNPFLYAGGNPITGFDPWGLKDFQFRFQAGGGIGYIVIGGGVFDVQIKDMETGESSVYLVKAIGIGVGLPTFRVTSKWVPFSDPDPCKKSSDFEGYGYLGGASAEVGAGITLGGGIKIPNGPFLTGDLLGWTYGGVDIGVSHSLTHFSLQ